MPIATGTTVTKTVQLTDGNWNRDPTFFPDPANVKITETVILTEPPGGWTTIDLSILGDFNNPKEVLWVEIVDDTSSAIATLFDTDFTNDHWFTGEATGPTNGFANPLQGARPDQGNITINGNQGGSDTNPFTEADIDTIFSNTAVFASDSDRVEITGDLSGLSGDLTVTFTIQEFDTEAQEGVDFAEIVLSYGGGFDEWMSGNAISNVVFYLQCDDEIIKVKIDDWDDLGTEYKSTEMIDVTTDNVEEFVAEMCGLDDCDFIGLTIKAGNNREDGFRPNQANGEGEIVFGDILGEYGRQNDFDCVVQASDVFADYFLIV